MKLKRVVAWFDERSAPTRLVLGAVVNACVWYGGALVSAWLADVLAKHEISAVWAYIAVILVLLILVFMLGQGFHWYREALRAEADRRYDTLMRAYTSMEQLCADTLKTLESQESDGDRIRHGLLPSADLLDRIMVAVHWALDASYGESIPGGNRVSFETTFMTKSYVDGEVTIAASCNRDRRAPRSLARRAAEPKLYDKTETAHVYRDENHAQRVIEDTRAHEGYAELYQGQLDRLRSSVIHPVLSSKNEILGTLVLHCDRPGFFRKADAKFWSEFGEVFSKPLALAKRGLDELVERRTAVSVHIEKPF